MKKTKTGAKPGKKKAETNRKEQDDEQDCCCLCCQEMYSETIIDVWICCRVDTSYWNKRTKRAFLHIHYITLLCISGHIRTLHTENLLLFILLHPLLCISGYFRTLYTENLLLFILLHQVQFALVHTSVQKNHVVCS